MLVSQLPQFCQERKSLWLQSEYSGTWACVHSFLACMTGCASPDKVQREFIKAHSGILFFFLRKCWRVNRTGACATSPHVYIMFKFCSGAAVTFIFCEFWQIIDVYICTLKHKCADVNINNLKRKNINLKVKQSARLVIIFSCCPHRKFLTHFIFNCVWKLYKYIYVNISLFVCECHLFVSISSSLSLLW